MLISLVEYAERAGRDVSAMRRRAERGDFETAQKIGRNWIIDSDEPLTDKRIKSGRYVGARKKTDS